jgi:hypothetical protein
VRTPKKTPRELGYRFYRGYIYRRRPRPSRRIALYDPWGRFLCDTHISFIRILVDTSIERGDARAPERPFNATEQLSLI